MYILVCENQYLQKECIFILMKRWIYQLILLLSLACYALPTFGQDDDEPQESPLMLAVKANNYKEVVRLVTAGAPVNEKKEYSWKPDPLSVAIDQNFQEIAKFLLAQGATSRSGLYGAIETGDVEWVKLLLSYNFTSSEGIMAAVESKNIEMVKLLIAKGFKVNFTQKRRLGLFRKEYVSPIDVALDNGSEAIAYELVRAGVPVLEAYQRAVYLGMQKLCIDLIDLGNSMDQLYLMSFQASNFTLVNYCLKKGANPNAVDIEGYNVLLLAVKSGSLEGINYALDQLKISPTSRTKKNETALMIAAKGESIPVFEKVLTLKDLSIESVNDLGETVLFYAARNEKSEFISPLLLRGAFINQQNSVGQTPWMVALENANWSGFLLFYEQGIDDQLKDKQGRTILSYLFTKYNADNRNLIIAYLSKGIDPNSVNINGENLAYYAIEHRDMDLLQRIQSAGGSVDGKNNKGERPNSISREMLDYILLHGADVDRKNAWGNTYLADALTNNELELAVVLIRNKANVNVDNRNDEPLILTFVEANNLEVVKILAESNANLQVKNRWGKGLLEIAMDEKDDAMVAYLRSKGALTSKELADRMVLRSAELAKIPEWIAIQNIAPILTTLRKYPETRLSNEQLTQLAIISIKTNNLELLQFLVEHQQLDLTRTINFQQQTLLHLAAEQGNFDCVRLLVNKGVNVAQKDALDQLPMDLAKTKEIKKYLKALLP